MLTAIFEWLKSLVTGVLSVVDFVVFLVSEIVETVALAGKALVYAGSVIAQLPIVWVSAFTAIITIAVIFKVKG